MSGHLNDCSFIRLTAWIIICSIDKLLIRLNVWTTERLNVWTCVQLNVWTPEQLNVWTLEQLNVWTLEQLNVWTIVQLNVWTEEWKNIQLNVQSLNQTDIQSCEHGFETLPVWEKFIFQSRFSSIAINSSCPCMSAFWSEQFSEYVVIIFTKGMLPTDAWIKHFRLSIMTLLIQISHWVGLIIWWKHYIKYVSSHSGA